MDTTQPAATQPAAPPQSPAQPPSPAATAAVVPGGTISDPFYRFWAAVLDGFIIGITSQLILILIVLVGMKGQQAQLAYGIVAFLLLLAYNGYLLVTKGTTIGKEAFGMEVVKYGTKDHIAYPAAFIREFVKSGISYIPVVGIMFSVVNGLVVIFSKEKRGFHDKAAKSIVIKSKTPWSRKKRILSFVIGFIIFAILANLPYSRELYTQ